MCCKDAVASIVTRMRTMCWACAHQQYNACHAVSQRQGFSILQAARAASSAAQPKTQSQEPKEPLPAFGSGIQFRPTKKAKQQPTTQAPQKPVAASNLALQDEIEQESEDALMLPAAEPVAVRSLSHSFGKCSYCQSHMQ